MKKLLIAMSVFAVAAVWAMPAKEGRIDIYNNAPGATVKITDKGNAYRTSAEKWMQQPKRGGALALFKFKGNDWQTLTVTVQAVKDGNLEIQVKGPDVRAKDNKTFLPANVDVAKVVVNGKVKYEGKNGQFLTVWHNASKCYKEPARNGQTFKVEVTVRPSAK